MRELTCLSVFFIGSVLLAIAMIVAGFICQYHNTTATKISTYECGMETYKDARIKFDIRYLNYAILFLIFDVETIFLYPFAIHFNSLGLFSIIECFIFVLILLGGLFFVIKKRFLRWL